MQDFRFFLRIVSLLTTGPLTSVRYWRYTARMDGAGSIAFEVSATDEQAQYLQNRSEVHAFALLGGEWTEVGAGIVDKITRVTNQDGSVSLQCSGLDLVGEFNTRGVRDLEIGEPSGTTLADALSILNAFAPSDWSLNANSIPPTDFVYTKFDGESMLGALIYIAQKTGTHFYRTSLRQLVFDTDFEDSGITVVKARGNLNDSAVAATVLDRTIDTHELQTKMYGWGSGEDRQSSLSMIASDRTPPAGYTFNAAENWIQNDDAIAEHGIIDFPEVNFKEITTISNTNADYVAASNALFDSVLHALQERSTLDQQVKYDLALSNCQTLLRPLQTVRVLYYDPDQDININDNLYILEATLEWNSSDLHTTGLVVSTHDHWPKGANDNAASRAIQGKVFAGHKQISVNEWQSHKEMLIGDDQADHIGEFPFIFSLAVVQVMQVYFRFKVEQILAAVYTYELADNHTENNSAENTGDTAAGTTESGGGATSGTRSIATVDQQQNVNATTLTIASGAATVTPDSTTGNESAAGDPHTHDFDHGHTITADFTSGANNHYHTGVAHGHTISPNPHDHTTPAHTHTITDVHSHVSPVHEHGLPVLNETAGLVRFPALSTYALSDLEFSVNGGISTPGWDPDVDGWASLDLATDASDGYWQIDITEEVTHPTIPFRPAQASGNNVIEIRCKSGVADNGKSALVSVVLYVRTTIQGIALSV